MNYVSTPAIAEPELLLHFTSFESFLKIWSTKSLLFSDFSRLNDLNDAFKLYFDDKKGLLQKEMSTYKQISLMRPSPCKQYCAMWGHYGRNGQGVCIELRKADIKKELQRLDVGLYGPVNYVSDISPIQYDGTNLSDFMKKNQSHLFFQKTCDWSYEREFRIVARGIDKIDISEAIQCITITHLFGLYLTNDPNKTGLNNELFQKVLKPIIDNKVDIWEFLPTDFAGSNIPEWKNEKDKSRYPTDMILDV